MIVRRLFYVALAIAVLLLALSAYTLMQTRGGLQDTPRNHAFGPQNAGLIVVGFLDFGCIHCREAEPVILEAVQKDGNVRFIPRLVILSGSDSEYNTRLAYAAGLQNKFREAFRYMMEHYRPMTESDIPAFAEQLGLDPEQLKKDVKSGDVDLLIIKSHNAFTSLGANSTPTFFFGDGKTKYIPPKKLTVDEYVALFATLRGRV